jgi:ribosomal protein S8
MKFKRLIANLVVLRNASKANKISTVLYKNSLTLNILLFFYNEGYITGFQFLGLYKVRVYLKYFKDKGLLSGIQFPKKINRFCSYLWLKRNYRAVTTHFLMVLTTSKGVLTASNIIHNKLNVGGLVLFFISYY